MQVSTSIPIKGDEFTKKAIRKLAGDQGIDMGDVVLNALKHQYGSQFDELVRFFRAKDESKNSHVRVKETA